jgi:hypothetical protein
MLDRLDVKYFKLAVGLDSIGKESDVDVSARCPVCGDSRKNKRSKRLHLYKKGEVTNINCFNGDCDVQNKTPYSFLRDFFPALLQNYKRENFNSTMSALAGENSEDVFSSFVKETETKDEVVLHDLTDYLHDISEHEEALNYLNNRGITYNEEIYGKWYFGFQDLKIGEIVYKITNAIVIPLYYNGKMYGFYSRSILDKTFYTYMHDSNIGYKVWNWFNVNKNEKVYIFEGIFDAIASGLPNVIALMGAKLPEDRLKELNHPVFVLDNDRTGLMNSLNYCKMNYVYIQPDKYKEKDMNDLMLNNKELNITELISNNLFTNIIKKRIK